MDHSAFLALMNDTLQRDDALTMDMPLTDVVEWDSLSAMATLALAERRFGKRLKLSDFKKLVSVKDIYELLSTN